MMKKISLFALSFLLLALVSAAAASWDNNEYQRKSRMYSRMAVSAYDEGNYDGSVEYSRLAEENALLSAQYISGMIARSEAEKLLFTAHTRLNWAKSINAERFFPSVFSAAGEAVSSADAQFASEDWAATRKYAEIALSELSVVREIVPLPAEYKVDLWADSKDCLWNIAANPAIYGNPLLWEKLYEANRKALKQPSNPNLLMPGQVVSIPSIKGEFREGRYDPAIEYEPFSRQVK